MPNAIQHETEVKVETATELSDRLKKKIGKYDLKKTAPTLSNASQAELYKGCEKYKAKHAALVDKFKRKYNEFNTSAYSEHFFQACFIAYISEKIASTEKDTNSQATIELAALLGPEGAELYHLALEEESYSKAFRDSVLATSTDLYEGKTWATRPVVFVAGPSASGKSTAARNAILNADTFLAKKSTAAEGNLVISVDGGKIRETSQIRKLAIQAAITKGYSGIQDLHEKSDDILGPLKGRIREAAIKSPYGIVIPETFSKAGIPVIGKWLLSRDKTLKRLIKLPNSLPIFCHVKGKKLSTFRRTVRSMGTKRAWATQFSNQKNTQLIDLNRDSNDLCESKAYNPQYFDHGLKGSKRAEHWYERSVSDPLKLIVENDFVIVYYDTETHKYELTQEDAPDRIFISEQILIWWNLLTFATQQKENTISLDAHIPFTVMEEWKKLRKQTEQPSLADFNKAISSLVSIKTYHEMKLDYAIYRVDRQLSKLFNIVKKKASIDTKEANHYKVTMFDPLDTIMQTLRKIDTRKIQDIEAAIQQITAFKETHPHQEISSLPRILSKLLHSHTRYVGEKSLLIFDDILSILTAIKRQYSQHKEPVLAIQSTGLLSPSKRQELTTYITNRGDSWKIAKEEANRIEIANSDNAKQAFSVTDKAISTTYKDATLFKKMVETFLTTNPTVGRMRIQAHNAEIKDMMSRILTELKTPSDRYRIEIPVSVSTNGLFQANTEPKEVKDDAAQKMFPSS